MNTYFRIKERYKLEKKPKASSSKITSFGKKRRSRHFTGDKPPVSDVLGSYTGTPLNMGTPVSYEDMEPTQDADDL